MPSKVNSGELCAPDSAQTRPYEAMRPGRAAEQRDQSEKEGGQCPYCTTKFASASVWLPA